LQKSEFKEKHRYYAGNKYSQFRIESKIILMKVLRTYFMNANLSYCLTSTAEEEARGQINVTNPEMGRGEKA
jgi:hypothetical protein